MPLSLADFSRLVGQCWSLDTASTYSSANPAIGQCSVTALVAQDYFGGDIAKTRVGNAWYFYNLINGERFDFTASQFDHPVIYDDIPAGRDDALIDTTLRQYEALAASLRRVC